MLLMRQSGVKHEKAQSKQAFLPLLYNSIAASFIID